MFEQPQRLRRDRARRHGCAEGATPGAGRFSAGCEPADRGDDAGALSAPDRRRLWRRGYQRRSTAKKTRLFRQEAK